MTGDLRLVVGGLDIFHFMLFSDFVNQYHVDCSSDYETEVSVMIIYILYNQTLMYASGGMAR